MPLSFNWPQRGFFKRLNSVAALQWLGRSDEGNERRTVGTLSKTVSERDFPMFQFGIIRNLVSTQTTLLVTFQARAGLKEKCCRFAFHSLY